MLKKFFLNLLSSFVGAWLAMVLFCVVAVIVVIGVAARFGGDGESRSVKVGSDSVLLLDLSGTIIETPETGQIDFMSLAFGEGVEAPTALNVLIDGIREGKESDKIKAMYIKCGHPDASPATLNAIRQAVADFRKSGKKVYAYADVMTMGDYFVAAQADSLFLNPGGAIEISGIGGTSLFFKEFLDKIGVKMTLVKVGTFKSAAEPYISNEMSAPARAQLDTLYGNMWNYIGRAVAEGRKALNDSSLNKAANEFIMLQTPASVLKQGFVDRLVYERQVDDIVGRLVGEDGDDVQYYTPETLSENSGWGKAYASKSQVAVLYATGEIQEHSKSGIDCYRLVPMITDLADDDDVKALVLRVNSPGGSVFGSEQIGEALDYFKSKGKPFIVSMGDYAASGGYWISCTADRIFADPLTITGSIGIFGLFPSAEGLMKKLGITPQTVSTNPGKNISVFYDPTPGQLDALQKYIDEGYSRFVRRVAKGRKMDEKRVRQIAEGRVYDAEQAMRLKLVDSLGSLDDAVAYAASEAGLKEDKYGVAVYPKYKPDFMDILKAQGFDQLGQQISRISGYDPESVFIRETSRLLRRSPWQARMTPLCIRFN
ncbi:MAG: signal peptide peptidase SppA [Muribaculaceae bacterium]|nr:signal peptide peptidase SppA [Muribaculaceae bacterium]MDE6553911.1 signal peptide peptidase SppA [Muribaculaceae bacterium]